VIVLVRHGQTDANRAGLLLGRADPPLTERGRQQATAVAAALAQEAEPLVFVSPLQRARETAARIEDATGAPATVDDRLLELDYGEWDGRRVADIPADTTQRWRTDATFAPPGGESLAALHQRVAPFAVEALDTARDRTVIVVSHVSPIKALILCALGLDELFAWRLRLDVASISRLASGPLGPALTSFNETAHLR
jgi:broad specificity phosphatase PhoE